MVKSIMPRGFYNLERLGPTEYKSVYKIKDRSSNKIFFFANKSIKINGNRVSIAKPYSIITDAAKAIDLFLMRNGKEPVNIFKRKEND